MRTEPVSDRPGGVAPQRPRASFGPVLARARIEHAAAALPKSAAPAASLASILSRRRHAATIVGARLGARRADAHVAASVERRFEVVPYLADSRQAGVERPSPICAAPALDRLALAAGLQGDRSFVDMVFGPDLRIRLTRSSQGIDLVLQADGPLRATMRAELPRLVAGLRARGVVLARAGVGSPARGDGSGEVGVGGALTAPRVSARTAAKQGPGGTVAKW